MFLTYCISVLSSDKWEENHLIHWHENWDNVYKTWFQVFSKCYITDEEVEKASEKAAKMEAEREAWKGEKVEGEEERKKEKKKDKKEKENRKGR